MTPLSEKKWDNKTTNVFDCGVFELPQVQNPAGNLTAVEGFKEVPFDIKRVYYLYDVPSGQVRGGHAHYALQQFVMAGSGSLDITLDDGRNKRMVTLNRPNMALHIVPGIWRDLQNFSGGAICLVLASELYEAEDYIRDYDEFLKLKKQ
jgi:dTDP-4-dehydrorhamnose 3,5-epimerase-like enzyme